MVSSVLPVNSGGDGYIASPRTGFGARDVFDRHAGEAPTIYVIGHYENANWATEWVDGTGRATISHVSKVLVATVEPVGPTMAGPAIRASHIARVAIEAGHDVTFVSLEGGSTNPIVDLGVSGSAALEGSYDAAFLQGRASLEAGDLMRGDTPLAFDWFDPFHLEALERSHGDRIRRHDLVDGARRTLRGQAERGDFFVCSNEAQRDHWLGWLAAFGRCNSSNYDHDPHLRSLIDVAGFGTLGGHQANDGETCPIRASFDHVGVDDPIILWAGGLHDWLDPVTAVEAMPTIQEHIPNARLVFLAGPHPNTSLEEMGARGRAIARAKQLGLFGDSVLFATQWVDYVNRFDWLTSATVGLVVSKAGVEAHFSHRTRLVDHLDAGLATVTTRDEPFGDALIAGGAAAGVLAGDVGALSSRIVGLLTNDEDRRRIAERSKSLATKYEWETTLASLLDWFGNPQMAADRAAGGSRVSTDDLHPAAKMLERARLHASEGGAVQVAERAAEAAKRRLRQLRS